jgi:DNA polymerase-3 subunit delta'
MNNILPWHEQTWQYLVSRKNLDKLPHAILLGGVSGVGKFSFAKNLSSLLLCQKQHAAAPCEICDACVLMQTNNHPDLFLVQPEEQGKLIKFAK